MRYVLSYSTMKRFATISDIREFKESSITLETFCDLNNIDSKQMRGLSKQLGVSLAGRKKAKLHDLEKQWFLENYAKYLRKEVASLFGMSTATLKVILKKEKIDHLLPRYPRQKTRDLIERNQKILELRNKGISLRKIGKEFGISGERVRLVLLKLSQLPE